jgi:hypothetical protein
MIIAPCKKRVILLIFSFGLYMAGLLFPAMAQSQQQSGRGSPPQVSEDEINPSSAQSDERKAKSGEFDGMGLDLEDKGRSVKIAEPSHWWLQVPALPFEQADLVIIGTPESASAHVSNNKKGIYSEFAVILQQVISARASTPVPSTIQVDRPGGRIRYRSGTVITANIRALPQTGRTYVFFLRKHAKGGNYSIITGYDVTDSSVKPLDSEPPFEIYENENTNDFLQKVRERAIPKIGGQPS